MKILPKVGDKEQITDSKVRATLRWKTSIDLDLHCFYLLKGQNAKKKGFIKKILEKIFGPSECDNSNSGHIFFSNRGSKNNNPHIWLDKDSGVGDVGGDNEENIYFENLSVINHALIVANIYNKNTNFSRYNGKVIVKTKSQEIEVPLTCKKNGSWCVVARIDNETGTPHLINVNKTMTSKPSIPDFL